MSQNVVVGWSRTGKMTFLLGPRSSPLYAKGAYCIVIYAQLDIWDHVLTGSGVLNRIVQREKRKKLENGKKTFSMSIPHACMHISILGLLGQAHRTLLRVKYASFSRSGKAYFL